jgi:hypothetical protein
MSEYTSSLAPAFALESAPCKHLAIRPNFTRFRDMRNVHFPTRRREPLRVWRALVGLIGVALWLPAPAPAQVQPPSPSKSSSTSRATTPGAKASDATKGKSPSSAPRPKDEGDDSDAAAGTAASGAAAADPSQTNKIVANEIFRDPKVDKLKLLDINKFPHTIRPQVQQNDILQLNAMAGGADANVEKAVIDRVVDAMASRLTDHANIQALIDPPARQNPNAPTVRAIQEATSVLLEPIFLARSANNQSFLSLYNRTLIQKLTPLLKNHLIPRIQAMIVLGQSGSVEMLPIYEAQIKDPNQTIWVKLWALEGIVNVVEGGARMTGQAVDAARVVADFLEKEDDIPWPAQLRAMEALSALRQGYAPNRTKYADMANAAMRLLADADSKPEVRAEAARALGLMQIGASVPKYNHDLVAHSVGLLAADLGTAIGNLVPGPPVKPAAPAPTAKAGARAVSAKTPAPSQPAKPARTTNMAKAKYFTSLLVGPVYQAFDGVSGLRESGLLHGASPAYAEKVFPLVKAVARAAVDLVYSGSRQRDAAQKQMAAQVEALRSFLETTAPTDRHLVPDGVAFPLPETQAAGLPAPQAQASAPR